jgi:light-regulated signal transduction histidine kinase (bacteriophytochrome)
MNKTKNAPSEYTACDNEPIHAPGAIQPFGILLAFDTNTLKLVQASENSRDLFGFVANATVPLGATAAELLGPVAEAALREALAKDGLIDHRPIPVSIPGAEPGRWHGATHCLGSVVFVELESVDEAMLSPIQLLAAVRASVGHFSGAADISEFVAAVARRVRSLTGYDRVMVYRFDAEWNGSVVAEERREDLEPFLGLHYPASDIPAQARALFLVDRIRVIPDAAAEPILMIMDGDARKAAPLDLSRCVLRSAAPVHREYLHNMGVKASLTASLIVGGRLWGMIACHHLTPRRPGPTEREAYELLSQVASAHLAFLAEVEDQEYQGSLAEALARTATKVGAMTPPIAALAKNEVDLLALVGASGAVVWRSGRGVPIGQTPPEQALPGLMHWIKQVAVPPIATDRLSQVYPPAKDFADVASGLLVLEVSRDADEYVLWFRPEVLQSVNWGGDPHGKIGPDGRLSPRRSFALWKESVRERSLPWRSAEVENAARVKDLLLSAAAVALLRLEALLPICAWCKKVRDEPDYWRGVEEFIEDRVDVRFTHGICPDCLKNQVAKFSAQKTKMAAS